MTARIITRTVYGGALQAALNQGINHECLDYTTLNQALTLPTVLPFQPDVSTAGREVVAAYDPATDTRSMMARYLAIGNKGHRGVTGPGNVWSSEPVPHKASDSGLYGQIPFAVREIYPANNDFPIGSEERARYRLRTVLQKDGKLYAGYFLRKLDTTDVTPEMIITTVNGSTITTSFFSPSVYNLHPPVPDSDVTEDGVYISNTAAITLVLTAAEIQLLKDACNLLYGSPTVAIISEIALVQAVEKPVTGVYPTTGIQNVTPLPNSGLFDVVGAQVSVHTSTFYPMVYLNDDFPITIDTGISEPLFGTIYN